MSHQIVPLTALLEGQTAKVQLLRVQGSMRRRLQDLGVIQGTPIQCLQRSPAGDPVAYRIRGTTIALRQRDCQDILVEANF